MKNILDEILYNNIWDKIDEEFKFTPSVDIDVESFKFKTNYKVYKLQSIWNEEQEKIVNDILKEMANEDIYALSWQHDGFEFNPSEEIELDYHYHDDTRNSEVYFPSYYPNGEYNFFISKDFSYGLLGHPWRKEIYVFGDTLINKFENQKDNLNIC